VKVHLREHVIPSIRIPANRSFLVIPQYASPRACHSSIRHPREQVIPQYVIPASRSFPQYASPRTGHSLNTSSSRAGHSSIRIPASMSFINTSSPRACHSSIRHPREQVIHQYVIPAKAGIYKGNVFYRFPLSRE